jgi:hypothetical protein
MGYSVASTFFSLVDLSDPTSSITPEDPQHQEALAALSDWQDAYLDDHDLRSASGRAETIPPEHLKIGANTQLTRAIDEGARLLGGLRSFGIQLPTGAQDRYEYMLLARYIEELRQAADKFDATMPSNVLFGSLPIGSPIAQSVRVPRTDYYLVIFNSGLFGYLYQLGRIIATCIPYEITGRKVAYRLYPADIKAGFRRSTDESVPYLTPGAAAAELFKLLRVTVAQGTPWASRPFEVQPHLMPMAETFVDASYAFVVGHEYGHLVNGDLDHAVTVGGSLGPASSSDLVDHSWNDEISADFVGLQAAMAACISRRQPTNSAYFGAHVYLRGIGMLFDAIALAAGREEGALDGQLWPPLSRRRQALRDGLEAYLSGDAAEFLPREMGVAEAVETIMDTLWSQCRNRIAGDGMKVHPLWQHLLRETAGARGHAAMLRPAQTLGEIAYDLLAQRATDAGSRRLLRDVPLAVAVTLVRDAASPDLAVRERAVRYLCTLDAEVPDNIPAIRLAVSKKAPSEPLGDDPFLVAVLEHFASRIRAISVAESGG